MADPYNPSNSGADWITTTPSDPRVRRIERSPLFDEHFYAAEAHSAFSSRLDAALHYVEQGSHAGLRPSLYFEPSFYANQSGAGPNGLVDYLTCDPVGVAEPHPLFEAKTYLAQLGPGDLGDLQPLEHYALHSQAGLYNPGPFFDAELYTKACPGGWAPGMTALLHYLQASPTQKKSPLKDFEPFDYLLANPDVASAGMDPLIHYVCHGLKEKRQLTPKSHARSRISREAQPMSSISIVLPTYNRASLLKETLEACAANTGNIDVEFVVIDDGSRDHTPEVLANFANNGRNVIWKSISNGGPGRARNIGANLATKKVLLFLGDDIQPLNPDFFYSHARLHAISPSDRFAVLGKCVWPEQPSQDINFVMTHIQGHGGEQFGYADLDPFTFIDWRFFYTANVSVKKSVISDWEVDGFRPEFTLAAFEDGELAYRLSKQTGGFTIFYDPSSVGRHVHPYTIDGFISRQMSAGMMAQVFLDMHPIPQMLGVGAILDAFGQCRAAGEDAQTADYMGLIEGVKSWARILERSGVLGREAWHQDLLFAVFEMSYLHGFTLAQTKPETNFSAGYKYIFSSLLRRMNRVIHHELSSHEFIRQGLLLAG